MFILAVVIGIAGLAAVIAGNYLQHVVAPRTLGSISPFVEVPAREDLGTSTLPRAPHLRPVTPDERPRQRRGFRTVLRRPSSSFIVFATCFAGYAAIGGILVLHFGSIQNDAVSRVFNVWAVFFSRDPHLSAVGFTWNPLPSVLVMPFLMFKDVWPDLVQRGFAGCLVSAALMAGCVVQIRAILRGFDLHRAVAALLLVSFALNPMIIYYGANGMSEACLLFFLVLATRYLLEWLRSWTLRPLVYAGLALGGAYLARYESAPAAAGALALVLGVTFARSRGSRQVRLSKAMSDGIVFIVPFAIVFVAWAAVSYVITGALFGQLSSQYGNSAQVKVAGTHIYGHGFGMPLPAVGAIQILAFGPLLPLALAVLAFRGWRFRDPIPLALVLLAGPIVFIFVGFILGDVFGAFRYYIPACPLVILCAAMALSTPRSRGRIPVMRWSVGACVFLALAIGLSGATATALAMSTDEFAAEEHPEVTWVFNHAATNYQRQREALVASAHSIAAALDARHFRSGEVVSDMFLPCMQLMLMTSEHPHQFVIRSDRDFERVVADPMTFGARYFLVPPAGGSGSLDAINRAHPGLYENGGGIATLVKEFHTRGCPGFRLYRVDRSVPVEANSQGPAS